MIHDKLFDKSVHSVLDGFINDAWLNKFLEQNWSLELLSFVGDTEDFLHSFLVEVNDIGGELDTVLEPSDNFVYFINSFGIDELGDVVLIEGEDERILENQSNNVLQFLYVQEFVVWFHYLHYGC